MSVYLEHYFRFKQSRFFKVKRCIDIIMAFTGLLFFSPIITVIAFIIKLSSKGSILFKHKRVGYMGREFEVYKFRTMVPDAEEYINYFTPEQMTEFKENYKLKSDPRVTLVGRFLRKTSLDELPQIINVLKGDMSVVGPRPVTKEELSKYGKDKYILLSVKPGITGLWQISGRSDTSYKDRVQLDIQYITNIHFLLDTKIILKTFVKVLLREGVY